MTWEELLMAKFGLWVDKRLSTDNSFYGSEKKPTLIQIVKATKSSNGNITCHVFSFEDAVAHLATSYPNEILTIER